MARKVGPLTNILSYSPSGMSTGASGKAALPTSDPISHCARQEASCSKCDKLTDEKPPFCTWMKAEVPPGLADDPDCEGFAPKKGAESAEFRGRRGKERTVGKPTVEKPRKAYLIIGRKGMGMTEMPIPLKANEKRAGKLGIEPSQTACPKTSDKTNVRTCNKPDCRACIERFGLDGKILWYCPEGKTRPKSSAIQTALKLKAFKGSVVREKVCCGKPGCRCHTGALHGPYPYLHYYSNGKVKRRYLTKTVSVLLSHSTKELEEMLVCEAETHD